MTFLNVGNGLIHCARWMYDIVSYYGGDSKPMAANGGKQAL
jgi:hypothetical protein